LEDRTSRVFEELLPEVRCVVAEARIEELAETVSRRAVALVAFDLSPTKGTESGTAHQWLRILSRRYRLEVYVHERHREEIERFPYGPDVHFHFVSVPRRICRLFERLGLHTIAYWFFMRACKPLIVSGQHLGSFELVHFITPAGLYSYNRMYKVLHVRYIVGPLGGGLRSPRGFVRAFGVAGSMVAISRDLLFWLARWNVFLRAYLSHAARIVVGTETQLAYVPRRLHSRTRTLFDTMVDMADFPLQESLPESETIQILVSGRLVRLKGGRMFVDALRLLNAKRPELVSRMRVVFAGDGSERDALEKRVDDAGLNECVCFLGRVPRIEVLRLLRESDIFCLPTIRESGGTAILEAMATGLPVITSDYGGPRHSVSAECGVRIPVLNYSQYVRDLASAIENLAGDAGARRSMGAKARERVLQHFSTTAVERKVLSLYSELFAGDQKSSGQTPTYTSVLEE
jgi:glycosyltransferase involved in cell wall biosynthesis